jgi:hypothetical protein
VSDLPVDPERLQREFPELTGDDLEAYVAVTRKVLAAGPKRAVLMKQIIEGARQAQQKMQEDATLSEQEKLWVRYLAAVEKMQRATPRR